MSVFSIILLVLFGLYIVVIALDKFVFTPRRDMKTLPEVNRRLAELEKMIDDLRKDTDVIPD